MMVNVVESVKAYRIGNRVFVVDDEVDGRLHEITTGRMPNQEEWAAFNKFLDEKFQKEKQKEKYDRQIAEATARYDCQIAEESARFEEAKKKIYKEIYGY